VLETLDLAGVESVLDLGSGTGILALAALRLGAQRAVCVDPEAAAVRTSQRNAQLNGVEDRVVHVQGTLAAVAPWPFDLVLANLYGEVLLAEAAGLVARLGSTSRLLLSGILWQDQFAVEQSYCRLGCAIERTWMLEAYCTLLLRRGSPL
jgi:ribosomal protein L11 methyltransferase